MGAKREKSKSLLHTRKTSSLTISTVEVNNSNAEEVADQIGELTKVAMYLSWCEMFCVTMGMVALLVLTIMTGLSASVSISIHYFGATRDGLPFMTLLARDLDPNPLLRSTILVRSVARLNRMPKPAVTEGLQLGRVVTVTASGRRQVLSVVEESDPIETGEANNETSESPELTRNRRIQPPRLDWEARIRAPLCEDGETYGFDTWKSFEEAVHQANVFSAERFMKWNEYFALSDFDGTFVDNSFYYEEQLYLTICPRATLRARKGPIFINAENLRIDCCECTIDSGGSHLSFGPFAKNVLVRGITFRHAQHSSLVLFHDGAEASFEDCLWRDNLAISAKHGGVADMNSSSIINFFRCEMGQKDVSSLSIRS